MTFRVPLFDLNFGPEEEMAVMQAVRSRWISMGPACQEVEDRFGALLGTPHAVAVTNCTAALHLALAALDVGPGDEVIVPSMTFVATVNAVRYVGAEPVFADIVSLGDISLSPEDVESRITSRTKAVVVMHYGGFACEMDRILDVARRHGLAVVEDAAHAPAAKYGDAYLGTMGDIGCFSFFSNKNITCAEGGLLVSRREELAAKARLMRAHGMTSLSYERANGHATSYDVVALGYNYRLDDIRGALLLAQMDRLESDLASRAVLRAQYEKELDGVDGVIVPYKDFGHVSSNYIMPVILAEGGAERRDQVRERMAAAGIQTSVHYPAVHRFEAYRSAAAVLPLTEHVADHEFTLPMYATLTADQVSLVCEELRRSL
jgi:dTDP-4-amino-4,6-dideoxygalactose transaminase